MNAVDKLIHNVLELHMAVINGNEKAIDQKIQEVIKQYSLIKPESRELQETYEKSKFLNELAKPLCRLSDIKVKTTNIKDTFVKIISKNFPNLQLDQRIERMERFARTCIKDEVLNGKDGLAPLESIINEGQVDINAISVLNVMVLSGSNSFSLLGFALYSKADKKVIDFLLSLGAKPNMQNYGEVWAAVKYLVRPDSFGEYGYCDTDLLDELIRDGLDVNVLIPYYPKDLTLLSTCIQNQDYPGARNLIFHGAEVNEQLINTRDVNWRVHLCSAFQLRDEMLDKMQRHLPSKDRKQFKDLSVSEREQLAKLCSKADRFRRCYESTLRGGYLLASFGTIEPELQKQVDLHKQFAAACLAGRFEEAEKLMPQGIDISADAVHPFFLACYPLLNHACHLGDEKLVKFLLKHGADPNIGGGLSDYRWLPPIFECAASSLKNKAEIMELLLKAGANPNAQCAGQPWASSYQLWQKLVASGADIRSMLNDLLSCGVNLSQPNKEKESQSFFDYYFRLADIFLHNVKDPRFKKEIKLLETLIFYGVKISESNLKKIHVDPRFNQLVVALKLCERALDEVRHIIYNEHLQQIDALKPLSLDLIDIIGGYPGELEVTLTPAEQIAVANCCFTLKEEGNPES